MFSVLWRTWDLGVRTWLVIITLQTYLAVWYPLQDSSRYSHVNSEMGKREELSEYTPFQAIDGRLIRLAIMYTFLRDIQTTKSDLQFKGSLPTTSVHFLLSQ